MNACEVSAREPSSLGCEFYATAMDSYEVIYAGPYACFVGFVTNTSPASAHIAVSYAGKPLPVASFARVAVGAGADLVLEPYDDVLGLPSGEVAILFLGGTPGLEGEEYLPPWCPVPAAVPEAAFTGTGLGHSFRVTTDVPVAMYQLHPWRGGSSAATGASMLLPTSAWGADYIAVNPGPQGLPGTVGPPGSPSLNIIAREDGTRVVLNPVVAVEPGPGVVGGPANQPIELVLDAGQHVQITQPIELTGSTVTATHPVGLMAGHQCLNAPADVPACDHAQQMVPSVQALGHRYVGVMYPPRRPVETSTLWRFVGVVDGTQLTYSTDIGGPSHLDQGDVVELQTGTPFVVSSQDANHPFLLFTYMTGADLVEDGYGDADFVLNVSPDRFLRRYVLFADPAYPETRLVLVRARGSDGEFKDVELDCRGIVQGWRPVASSGYEYAHVDITTGFSSVDGCSTGRLQLASEAPFGVTLWGWGIPYRWRNVSYGFPGGMDLTPNPDVVIRRR